MTMPNAPPVSSPPPIVKLRIARGKRAQSSGLRAETVVCDVLRAEGWTIHGQRVRTLAGEVDVVAERDGLLVIVEVKHRPSLADAAAALSICQRNRLLLAAEILLGENPEWGRQGVRFDVFVIDAAGTVRRIADAFRSGDT